MNPYPRWTATLTDVRSQVSCTIPPIAPKPLPPTGPELLTSTYRMAPETYQEALEIMAARQAVLARRAAAAAGEDTAEAGAAAMASVLAPVDSGSAQENMAAAHAHMAAPTPAPGSQAWVDEWAPAAPAAPRGRRQQQRRGGRGGRRGRRRGGRTARGAGGVAEEGSVRGEAEAGSEGGEAELTAVVDASLQLQRLLDSGLEPLPAGLVACSWDAVAAMSLPQGDAECVICNDEFTQPLERGEVRLVVQLRCRHTFCELCLRQFNTNRSFRTRPLTCPTCRGAAVPPE